MTINTNIVALVAEDNANLRKVLVNIMNKIGFRETLEADNGNAAWDLIRQGRVGLLLTDWSMPGLSGLELVVKVRGAEAPIRDIPVLMVTAMDTRNSIVMAGKQGVDAYIIKPFSVRTITEKIEEAFRKRAAD